MVGRPLPLVMGCPNCRGIPKVKYHLLKGARAECSCGVCGPYTTDDRFPDHEALVAWGRVFGFAEMKRPAPPAPMTRMSRPGGARYETPRTQDVWFKEGETRFPEPPEPPRFTPSRDAPSSRDD